MKKVTTIIIGGGFSGMVCAANLNEKNQNVLLIERLDRLGKKLSATGNGQGNLTNTNFGISHYFTNDLKERQKIENVLANATEKELISFFEKLGGLFFADERGRVYPTSRQASSLTDLLRHYLSEKKTEMMLSSKVTDIKREGEGFIVSIQTADDTQKVYCENIVVCAGGKSAKNFGTDGNGYDLAKKFKHTTTELYPALVQLKTDTSKTKALKGIRVVNAKISAFKGESLLKVVRGDLLFTEFGVSGDGIFKLSSYLIHRVSTGNVRIAIDLLPEISIERLRETLDVKQKSFTGKTEDFLCGILNNQIGRMIMREGRKTSEIVEKIKNFSLEVTGSLGFDYAQVTKGGIPLSEMDENLQSRKQNGLYFAGEILDVDGECGGYNLQWAYSSAITVANALNKKYKAGGQV